MQLKQFIRVRPKVNQEVLRLANLVLRDKLDCGIEVDEYNRIEETVFQFLKETQPRHKIGVMVADVVDGEVRAGWSLANRKDKFDQKRGTEIAMGRLQHGTSELVPDSIRLEYEYYVDRANRYFKDAQPLVLETILV